MEPAPTLAPHARAAIVTHLESAWPEEGCGVLLGRAATPLEILEAVPGRNLDPGDRTVRYTLAPEDLVLALARARAASLKLLGFYHSHPGASPCFSLRDQEAAWPRMLYLVVSLRAGRAAGFSWHMNQTQRC